MADELLSTTIITAYLMWKNRKPLPPTLLYIRDYTSMKLPKNLMRQLVRWDTVLKSQNRIITIVEVDDIDKSTYVPYRCSMCRSSKHNAHRCPGY